MWRELGLFAVASLLSYVPFPGMKWGRLETVKQWSTDTASPENDTGAEGLTDEPARGVCLLYEAFPEEAVRSVSSVSLAVHWVAFVVLFTSSIVHRPLRRLGALVVVQVMQLVLYWLLYFADRRACRLGDYHLPVLFRYGAEYFLPPLWLPGQPAVSLLLTPVLFETSIRTGKDAVRVRRAADPYRWLYPVYALGNLVMAYEVYKLTTWVVLVDALLAGLSLPVTRLLIRWVLRPCARRSSCLRCVCPYDFGRWRGRQTPVEREPLMDPPGMAPETRKAVQKLREFHERNPVLIGRSDVNFSRYRRLLAEATRDSPPPSPSSRRHRDRRRPGPRSRG